MTTVTEWLRRQLPGVVALVLVVSMFFAVRLPGVPAAERAETADSYAFTPMNIAMPGGYRQQKIRRVNKAYKHIDAWISSVGAGIAMNDLDGDGLANDLCISEPRIDQVVVTPAPGAGANRYAPFALSNGALPMNDAIAPMGCVPGDFNEDGRTDLLVYLWGRTPIVHLARPGAEKLGADAYTPTELVPNAGGSTYTGPKWNSNAAAVDDFDGDGHDDIYIGNYFPHSPVLDPTVDGGVKMNRSLSQATNGGPDYILRRDPAVKGAPLPYQLLDDAIPQDVSKGWVLASAANDLDGDQLPELYIAQDHGTDALLHNRSVPGKIRFAPVKGPRSSTATVPKSKRLGGDSFKGMGIDYADLDHNGVYDMFVSNITTSFGIQESNLHFIATVSSPAAAAALLRRGQGPWRDRSATEGTAWGGWCWDVKMNDFDNDGNAEIVQTNGFVKGHVNRWAQLQELAASNDLVLEHPSLWPKVTAGDDIAGSQTLNFFARRKAGGYANLSAPLGLNVPVPTRGIAVGDTDGDGRLEFAVARQWDEPVFYRNAARSPGAFLGLRLTHDTATSAGPTPAPGSPVVGAQVTVTTPDGRRHLARVDGGGGHSGKRSHEVHVGLGRDVTGPVLVHLRWRDRTGQIRQQELRLSPGWHSLRLGSQVKEK